MRLTILIIIIAMAVGCSQFPTEFSNVRSNDVRLIDIICEPAEAAPGDTVHVKAVFAGKSVSVADIDWKISYNVMSNMYGSIDTAFDVHPLESAPVADSFSESTSSMKFSMIIPSNIMHTSSAIPENWISLVPEYVRNDIPAIFKQLSKTNMLSLVEGLLENPQSLISNDSTNPNVSDIKESIPVLCQLFTVDVRLFADIKGAYQIRRNFSVRYNSKLKSTGLVYVNNNPIIDSVGIYKVPGNRTKYNPSENNHEFTRLDVPKGQEKTVLIDKDFSYFVNVFTNKTDAFQTIAGVLDTEQYRTKWFYELDTAETKNLTVNNFLHVNGDTLIATLTPPDNEKITTFTIWSRVFDDIGMSNVISRPIGSAIIEGRGKFKYTKAYLDNVNKK